MSKDMRHTDVTVYKNNKNASVSLNYLPLKKITYLLPIMMLQNEDFFLYRHSPHNTLVPIKERLSVFVSMKCIVLCFHNAGG